MTTSNDETATRAHRRAQTVPAAARLARSPGFRSATGHSQQLTIIPVLPDDTVAYLLDRLDEAGGSALLVLAAREVTR